ncbi:hypothetical protein Pmani_006102 [Petrolisthes manimaculis]|uniref:Uncharacterized protein n=1 Tax=Petrolisthes manimaculis TaxID=1843537 RepID=A0AAE1QB02_9EUCA|nr:hypothetical protein Pmani_006102 [Petrolisthes manimaculis]
MDLDQGRCEKQQSPSRPLCHGKGQAPQGFSGIDLRKREGSESCVGWVDAAAFTGIPYQQPNTLPAALHTKTHPTLNDVVAG